MKNGPSSNLIASAVMVLSMSGLGARAHAGVGGYASTTCVSGTGRTVLTIAKDHGSSGRLLVNLILDGQNRAFDSADPRVTFLVSEEDDVLIGKIDGSTHFGISGISKKTLRVVNDPRTGTFAETNSKFETEQLIKVTCKTFVQQP